MLVHKQKKRIILNLNTNSCKLLLEGDSYFNDENVDTQKINKDPSIKGYCNNDGCKTNGAGINALSAYIYMKFKESIKQLEHNDYDEYLLMWLSDKLFKMYHESQGTNKRIAFVYRITLNQAYDKYLKNHPVKRDYWVLLNMQQGLKNANLKYMSEFYKLHNNICKIIVDYNDKGAKSSQISKYSKNCLNQYKILYKNIPKCNSYLYLLNKLKGIYDDFRDYAIKKNSSNNDLKTKLQTLTTEDGKVMKAVRSFKTYDFSDSQCKGKKKKKTGSPPLQPTKLESTSSSPSSIEQTKDNQENTPDSQQQNSGSKQGDSLDGPDSGQVTTGNGRESTDGGQGDKGSQGGSDIGPGASGSQSTSWLSFDIGSSFFEIVSKGMKQLNNALDFVEQKKEQLTKVTNTIKDFYSTSVSNIKTAYDNSRNFLNSIIVHISSQPEKLDISDKSGDDKLGSDGTGGGPPTPNGSSPSQTDSPQTPSGTPYSSLPSENPGTETKGNGITKIGDIYVLKEYKQIGISIIVLLIPITLAIMHKYLLSGWRKEMTRKKNMKKIINSIGGKRTVQIIISSSSHKKQIKKSISFGYKEKSPSLNIYKLMQADPVPFINLFFLLIFFVYKRKDDSLEL
ncbi:hypothetical protein YYE_04907 [Plasmodium vinckei vinckei]|uniref:PIR protein CIR protein n=1 Tax=Plasmodium vinckei vinckei TaxID=54757 RepID=A0A081I981_PLAVN|nr:hypothetical protein YYE_04907 [Plasmodium vinckei vinckei]